MYKLFSSFSECLKIARVKILAVPFVAWFYRNDCLLLLRHQLEKGVPITADIGVNLNQWSDLNLFEQTERWLTKDQFLDEAQRRKSEGVRFYSVIRGGRLVYYSWVVPHQRRAWFPAVEQSIDFPDGTDVIFNAYTHPKVRGQGIHKQVLMRQLYDASQQQDTSSVFIAVDPKNLPARLAVEAVGFESVVFFWKKVRFGRVSRGESRISFYKF